MIEIIGLCKSYKEQSVYNHLNLSIKEAQVTSILGPSGCGKTTLLRILAGLEPYDSGEIIGLENKRIAYMFQEDRLMPWLNVWQNIAYVLKTKYNKQQIEEKIECLLKILQLEPYRDYPIDKLSGGMRRRIALGRALVYESEILLLDEPFKGLDETLKEKLYEAILKEVEIDRRTVICVTHDVNEARSLGDSIYLSSSEVINEISLKNSMK